MSALLYVLEIWHLWWVDSPGGLSLTEHVCCESLCFYGFSFCVINCFCPAPMVPSDQVMHVPCLSRVLSARNHVDAVVVKLYMLFPKLRLPWIDSAVTSASLFPYSLNGGVRVCLSHHQRAILLVIPPNVLLFLCTEIQLFVWCCLYLPIGCCLCWHRNSSQIAWDRVCSWSGCI